MTPQTTSGRLSLVFIVILALAALAVTILAPGFWLDNGLVYGAF
jgi:hypothetical protein